MASTILLSYSQISPAIHAHVLLLAFAAFAAISLLLCMLFGPVAQDLSPQRPWLQLDLTGFGLRGPMPGVIQCALFKRCSGVLITAIFNIISQRFG